MNKLKIIILFAIGFLSCENETETIKKQFLTEDIPNHRPLAFKKNLVPKNKLIHKGIFSPDLDAYYYTISDTSFERFDVYVIKKNNDHAKLGNQQKVKR